MVDKRMWFLGFDGNNNVLFSDIDPKVAGLKNGFYYLITLNQLSRIISSNYGLFPSKHTSIVFDFKGFYNLKTEDIVA